jgi:hypothetical protein
MCYSSYMISISIIFASLRLRIYARRHLANISYSDVSTTCLYSGSIAGKIRHGKGHAVAQINSVNNVCERLITYSTIFGCAEL